MAKNSTSTKSVTPAQKNSGKRGKMNMRPTDDMLGFHLRLANIELRRNYWQRVSVEIKAGHATLLQLIAANPGASQTAVAGAMDLDKASLVSLLDDAEEAGWLERTRSKKDRRYHELRLTPLGKSKASDLRMRILRMEKGYADRFSREEWSQFIEYLKRIHG